MSVISMEVTLVQSSPPSALRGRRICRRTLHSGAVRDAVGQPVQTIERHGVVVQPPISSAAAQVVGDDEDACVAGRDRARVHHKLADSGEDGLGCRVGLHLESDRARLCRRAAHEVPHAVVPGAPAELHNHGTIVRQLRDALALRFDTLAHLDPLRALELGGEVEVASVVARRRVRRRALDLVHRANERSEVARQPWRAELAEDNHRVIVENGLRLRVVAFPERRLSHTLAATSDPPAVPDVDLAARALEEHSADQTIHALARNVDFDDQREDAGLLWHHQPEAVPVAVLKITIDELVAARTCLASLMRVSTVGSVPGCLVERDLRPHLADAPPMQLPIEKWAAEAQLPGEAAETLREAAICHRAGAYRAALLFTYVTWGLVLRSRILRAKCPPSCPPGKWMHVQMAMSNEDKWDAEVFDATQMQGTVVIFAITDDLRTQIRYWKDRRNDCAHSKRNLITAAHVEAMWDFLRSNLDKLQVGGSVEDLVEKIRNHFDPNITSPSAPCDALARAIDATVPSARRTEFFELVGTLFKRSLGSSHYWLSDACRFFEAVLRVGSDQVRSDATRFLLANEEAMAVVLLAAPHHCTILEGSPEMTRKLWRTRLPTGGSEATALYAALLRNNLIPPSELSESHLHLIDTVLTPPPTTAMDFDALHRAGFFGVFRQRAFIDLKLDRFDWGNPHAEMIAYYLASFQIDDQVATALASIFGSRYYPNLARDRVTALLKETPAKFVELVDAISRLGLSWPEALLGPKPAAS